VQAVAHAQSTDPFWGCGLLGKDIDPTNAVWKDLIVSMQKTNKLNKVPTWNWDIQPHSDEKVSPDFLFMPNIQCGGTNAGAGASYLDQSTALPEGAKMATIALGGNEPDQVGYCQNYTQATHGMPCDGYKMRDGQCTGADECYCAWDSKAGLCRYDVTGCGMWPVATSDSQCTGQPFPFWCAGKNKKICSAGQDPKECCSTACQKDMVSSFSKFFLSMAYKGYTYATTPIVAGDLAFVDELLQGAGCDQAAVKALKGADRLKRGCPTHSAFHFYTTGCPADPESAITGFVDRVAQAKTLNAKYGLAGSIVNELGSLKGTDTQCSDNQIAAMMGKLFEHLAGAGSGVVSQMTWFSEQEVGGTFDLRLIRDGKLTAQGEQYKNSCLSWAQHVGVNADDTESDQLVV